MSDLPENMEVCRRSGKEPEKNRSNFNQTCSLLSRYLKKNGSFSELSAEVAKKLESNSKGKSEMVSPTARVSLPILESSSGLDRRQNVEGSPFVKPTDSLPKFDAFASPNSVQEPNAKGEFRIPAAKDREASQLTMFYAGQVLVFDNFPAEKVKDVISLARNASSHASNVSTCITGLDKVNPGKSVSFCPNVVSMPTVAPTKDPVQVHPQPQENVFHPQPQENVSGLRLARRSSLHKFFEKRKDRAIAKAPYQVNHNANASPSPKPETSDSLLNIQEAQTSNHLDLKL